MKVARICLYVVLMCLFVDLGQDWVSGSPGTCLMTSFQFSVKFLVEISTEPTVV